MNFSKSSIKTLTSFANIGETPKEWEKFRTKAPVFFEHSDQNRTPGVAGSFSEWLYRGAEEWAKGHSDLENQARPPLLWYRDLLRMVWASNDSDGVCLATLYGMKRGIEASLPMSASVVRPPGLSDSPVNVDANPEETTHGLLSGKPTVNGVSGEIVWEFPSEFQQSVYELMKSRWRTKICPLCGRYFVAEKTAQAFCSDKCTGEVKRKRALDYWTNKGAANRRRRKEKA